HTRDVVHGSVVVVTSPDTHDVVGGVTYRPIIAEIIGGAGLGGSRAYHAAIALPAILLGVWVQLQDVAVEKLGDARRIVGEVIGHHLSQLGVYYALVVVVLVSVQDRH